MVRSRRLLYLTRGVRVDAVDTQTGKLVAVSRERLHPLLCDPGFVMKIFLGILVAVLVAGSLFADYKWRQWMAARRRDRQ